MVVLVKVNGRHNRVSLAPVVVAVIDVSTKAVVTVQKLKWVKCSDDAVANVAVVVAQSTTCYVGVP